MGRGRRKLTEEDWNVKLCSLEGLYPEVNGIDWAKVFAEHPNVFESIANGMVKKFSIERGDGLETLYESEYSEESFQETLDRLWGDSTAIEMSNKTGLSPNVLRRLRSGDRPAMFKDMESVASAFGFDPGYFAEYRNGSIVSAINNFLGSSPETSMAWYKKVQHRKGIEIK